MGDKNLSLLELNNLGHAYLELIEKDEDSDKIIAKARATIWSYTLRMLKPYFETSTNQELVSGLKILVSVNVNFHEIYGFSFNIRDIDPTYTLGDIEKRRIEILSKLDKDGVLNMNKELDLPIAIQKIAIISSSTAAGYEDFTNQLNNNNNKYKFYYKLFPAYMQGEQTEQSIIQALDNIFEHVDFFDIVVIIRGGGSKSDLMSFDKFDLAYYITQFPLPVISGIGHEKDSSVVDIVSHTSLKTPTAVAEFLISEIGNFDNNITEMFENILSSSSEYLKNENENLFSTVQNFSHIVKNKVGLERTKIMVLQEKFINSTKNGINSYVNKIDFYKNEIKTLVKFNLIVKQNKLESEEEKFAYRVKNNISEIKNKLDFYNKSIFNLDPINILKKGYSITKIDGKVIKNAKNIKKGDQIKTVLYEDELVSIVDSINKNKHI